MTTYYESQVELLILCLPAVAKVETFALKGGTAINLFLQPDFPRLSVDIDLAYLPLQDRKASLLAIEEGLRVIQQNLEMLPGVAVKAHRDVVTKTITKLVVQRPGVEIKVEANPVVRGTVYPSVRMNLSQAVESRYELSATNVIVGSKADVYGSKICAALNRQHPRDLFDVQRLLKEGITEDIKKAFLIYLASHNRPMSETLAPNVKEIKQVFEDQFLGMERDAVSCESLEQTRLELIQTLKNLLTEQDKEFLIAIKKGEIKGEYIGLPEVAKLPALRWKIQNIRQMDKIKHQEAFNKLLKALEK